MSTQNRERIIREVLKILPGLAKKLTKDVASHAEARGGLARPPATGSTSSLVEAGAVAPPLSTAQVRTLIHLALYGPQTMGELAEGMHVTPASASGLVKPLVAAGLVERARDEQDERVVRVRLSPKAQELADRICAGWRREVETALEGMDDEACAHFLEGLERLAGKQE